MAAFLIRINLTKISCSYWAINTLEKKCEICSKVTINTPEQLYGRMSRVFIVNLRFFIAFSSVSFVNLIGHVSSGTKRWCIIGDTSLQIFMYNYIFSHHFNPFYVTDLIWVKPNNVS